MGAFGSEPTFHVAREAPSTAGRRVDVPPGSPLASESADTVDRVVGAHSISVFLLRILMLGAVLWRTGPTQGETPHVSPYPFKIPEGEASCSAVRGAL